MRISPAIAVTLLVAIAAIVGGDYMSRQRSQSSSAEPPPEQLPHLGKAPEFSLINQDSQSFDSQLLAGKPWVLNFFFSSCKHICPTINGTVKSLAAKFADKGINFVSVSVDPKRDTPERLHQYKEKFTNSLQHWHLLSATDTEIGRIQEELRVASGNLPDNHNTRFILVDSSGIIRGYYRALEEQEVHRLQKDLSTLLSQ